jgi:hypothetical protein
MVNLNFKKYLAEIVTEETGVDIPVERIMHIEIRDGMYVLTIKNSFLEEGSEKEIITQHELLAHIIDKLESNC